MKKFFVYDPPMCCSTGACGPEIDPTLTRFAAFLSQIKATGVTVERFNLAQRPLAFAQNKAVRALLESDGTVCLPLVYIDDTVALKGRYPDEGEQAAWIAKAKGAAAACHS